MVKQYIRSGASPRGAQTILLTAKVLAMMDGRYHVSPEDIRATVAPSLRHRLLLNFEGAAEGVSTDEILKEVMQKIPAAKL
jgi:MoxR-like ATPase